MGNETDRKLATRGYTGNRAADSDQVIWPGVCGSTIHGNCESLGSSADTIPSNVRPFSKPPSGSIGTGRRRNTWSDRHDPAALANEIVQYLDYASVVLLSRTALRNPAMTRLRSR